MKVINLLHQLVPIHCESFPIPPPPLDLMEWDDVDSEDESGLSLRRYRTLLSQIYSQRHPLID